jgi:hypothetical protein
MSNPDQDLISQIESIITGINTSIENLKPFLNDPDLNAQQKQVIIDRMYELSDSKKSLLQQLVPLYDSYTRNAVTSNDLIPTQTRAREIIQDETEKTRKQRAALVAEKLDRIKLAEINTYYHKKYNSHKQIMKTIVLICIPIIILSILGNKGLLPESIVILLLSIIIIFGVITIGYQIIDISNRDNMNFDAYNWKFNKSNAPEPVPAGGDGDSSNPWNYPTITCVGAACCKTGITDWDPTSKKCIIPPASAAS